MLKNDFSSTSAHSNLHVELRKSVTEYLACLSPLEPKQEAAG